MNLNQLNCFIAVAQYLNFTEAASELHLVQSAVSYSVAELEKELDVKLFIRDRKSVKLTPAGEVFLEEAFRISSLLNQSIAKTRQVQSGVHGHLSVAYVFAPIVNRFQASFLAFRRQYPDIEVRFNSFDSISISRMLETNELDIGFARKITLKNAEVFHWAPLYSEPLCAVVHRDHPLVGQPEIDLNLLRDEKLVLMGRKHNPGMFEMAGRLCTEAGFSPLIDDSPRDIFTVMMLVEMGAGYTILPACWRDTFRSDVYFADVRGEMCSEVGVAWKKEITNRSIPLFLRHLGITS